MGATEQTNSETRTCDRCCEGGLRKEIAVTVGREDIFYLLRISVISSVLTKTADSLQLL